MEPIGFWKEVSEIILNGMKFSHFIGYFIIALIGVLVFFMVQIYSGVLHDKRSPDKFVFKYMLQTAWPRMVIGFICIWAAIAYYGELSVKILGAEEPLALTGLTALLLGVGVDALVKGIIDYAKAGKTVVTKVTNGG